MDHTTSIELLNEMNWALMDVEFIQISPTHRCIRKLYILAKNGKDELEVEFFRVHNTKSWNGNTNVHFNTVNGIFID